MNVNTIQLPLRIGPTNFSPILEKACDMAAVDKYIILLMITDGEISGES